MTLSRYRYWSLPVASALLVFINSCATGEPARNCERPASVVKGQTRGTQAVRVLPPKRIFMVILENTDADLALTQPFFKELMAMGATLTNFHGVAHPSQPNYIALTAGSTLGVKSNDNKNLTQRHLADQIEENGKTWKLYAERYPGNCFLGAVSSSYSRKHVPFLSYTNVQSNPERCARVVPATQLQDDIVAQDLADFSMYIPDNSNNGHDTGVAYADAWFKRTFGELLKDPAFMSDNLVILTFDEATRDHPTNKVTTVLLGDSVKAGSATDSCYDHYDLLRTVQDTLGLGHLGRKDAESNVIEGIWKERVAVPE